MPTEQYYVPQTPVDDRIDQLVLAEPNRPELLAHRRCQAAWLKRIMTACWPPPRLQPFIGFDREDGYFIASWQSDTECHTLTIDAEKRLGWFEPWPEGPEGNPLPGAIRLDAPEAWEQLAEALNQQGERP